MQRTLGHLGLADLLLLGGSVALVVGVTLDVVGDGDVLVVCHCCDVGVCLVESGTVGYESLGRREGKGEGKRREGRRGENGREGKEREWKGKGGKEEEKERG